MIDVLRLEQLARRAHLRFGPGGVAGWEGLRRSVTKGQGLSFAGHREYQHGDDVRHVDWRVTARLARPFVKVFEQERAGTLLVLLDVSASMDTSAAGAPSTVAREVAGFLVFLAVQAGERVGMLLFTDRTERAAPPRRGRRHALTLVHALAAHTAHSPRTRLAVALEDAMRLAPRRADLVVISDFVDRGYEEVLRRARHRHDIMAFCLEPPAAELHGGLVRLRDPETGRTRWVDAGRASIRAAATEQHQGMLDARRSLLSALNVSFVELQGTDWLPALRRAGRGARHAAA